MDRLLQVINCLKPQEIQVIKDFFKKDAGNHGKRKQLLNILLQKNINDDVQAALLIYNKKPDSAYFHLKRRLLDDILNLLVLYSFDDSCESSELNAELNCTKLLMQAKLLISRGISKEARILLKKAYLLAEDFEIIDVKIKIKDILANNVHLSIDNASPSLNVEISKDLATMKQLLSAEKNILNFSFAKADNLSCVRNLEKIRKTYKRTGSKKIEYCYYLGKITYDTFYKRFDTAYNSGLKLLNLLECNPILKNRANQITVYLEVGKILMRLHRYKEAKIYLIKAGDITGRGMKNETEILEALFFAYFRNEEYHNAEKLLNSVMSDKRICADAATMARWKYFHANLLFSRGFYKESLNTLNYAGFKKEQQGWLIGNKIMELLNIIELKDYEWFEFKIESFRKVLTSLKYKESARYLTSYQLFKYLYKTQFNFNLTLTHESDSFSKLRDGQDNYYWDPMCHEVIKMDNWFSSKLVN